METQSIVLPDIPLGEFLGAENGHISLLAEAFPESEIFSRGHEIRLRGDKTSLLRIQKIVNRMVAHYRAHGEISRSYVLSCLNGQEEAISGAAIVYDARGEKITAKTPAQARFARALETEDLVFAMGASGTGKTFLAIAMALRALKKKTVRRVVLTRPMVEAGEQLGFLPGDLKEKMNPYLRPMYDALHHLLSEEKLQYLLQHDLIEIAPLAYMRGRTLSDSFVILDEAQNATHTQIKMLLTRMGPHTKMVLTGDDSQVDLTREKEGSGLSRAASLLQGVKGVTLVHFDASGTMRHALVREIIAAYQGTEARKEADVSRKKE